MRRATLLTIAVGVLLGLMAPNATARLDVPMGSVGGDRPATAKDYKELARALGKLQTSVEELATLAGSGWQPECRGYSPEKTVRCAAAKFDPEGGADKAVSVWQCESNFGIEPPHTDSYHGPFQYLYTTYEHQREAMPDVVEWYELSAAVHDVRSNILTAVAWAARHGWGAWTCA